MFLTPTLLFICLFPLLKPDESSALNEEIGFITELYEITLRNLVKMYCLFIF